MPILPVSVTHCHTWPSPALRTCLRHSYARAIIPVVAWCLGRARDDWTGFWTRGRAGAEKTRARGWHGGAWAGAYRRKDLVNLFQNSTGPRMTPQEPSGEPEVSIHLRRVRGGLTVHPASSQPHLIKEASSGFQIDRRGHDNLRGRVKRFILTNRFIHRIADPRPNGLPLHPHQEPQ